MDMLSAPEMDPSSFPLINQPMMDMSCAPLNPPVYFQQQTSQIPIQPGLEITSFPDFMPQSGLHLAPPHPPSLPPSLSDSASQGDAEDLRDPIFVKSEHGRGESVHLAASAYPKQTLMESRAIYDSPIQAASDNYNSHANIYEWGGCYGPAAQAHMDFLFEVPPFLASATYADLWPRSH